MLLTNYKLPVMKNPVIKKALVLFTAIGFSLVSFAQPGEKFEQKKEKVEAMKIGFITQEMSLTPQEAQKFWPVYNQMNDELEAVRKERHLARETAKLNFETMTDPEVEKLINDEMASQQKELDIRKKYIAQYKAVLPVKKVAQYYRAEEQFKRKLLEKMQEKRRE